MGKMVLEIPEDLSQALRIPFQEQSSRLCRELVPEAVWQEVVEQGHGHPGTREIASASWVRVQGVKDAKGKRWKSC